MLEGHVGIDDAILQRILLVVVRLQNGNTLRLELLAFLRVLELVRSLESKIVAQIEAESLRNILRFVGVLE